MSHRGNGRSEKEREASSRKREETRDEKKVESKERAEKRTRGRTRGDGMSRNRVVEEGQDGGEDSRAASS